MNNIDLRQCLLKLWKSVALTKKEYSLEEQNAADVCKGNRSSQSFFAKLSTSFLDDGALIYASEPYGRGKTAVRLQLQVRNRPTRSGGSSKTKGTTRTRNRSRDKPQCKNLNEIIDAEKLAGALKQQSEIDALNAIIRI